MSNNAAQQKKDKSNSLSTKLLRKLTLADDLSMNREPLETGMFRHWWAIIRTNLTSLLALNLMFFLFAAPIIVSVFFVFPVLETKFILDSGFNFVSDMGLGFTGSNLDTEMALRGIYMFRVMFNTLIIPGLALAGLGGAGLFYCMRNKVWGANVKIRVHFFRGIKLYWWKFMLAFTVIGIGVYGIVGSINAYFYYSVLGTAPWWIWIIMIGSCIFTLLTIIYMFNYLPSVTMYRLKHVKTIKNSLILSVITALPALMIMIGLSLPLFAFFNNISTLILAIFFLFYGFSFYALAVQCFGQFAADSFTNILYEQSVMQAERDRRRAEHGDRKKKNSKAKKGKAK